MTPTDRTRTSRTPLILGAILLLALAAGGAGTWYLFLRSSGPPPVIQQSAVPAGSLQPAASASTSAPGAPASASSGGLSGAWKVDPSIGSFSDFSSSFVGYRVQEELANVGANTAVGRTPSVSGSLTLDGSTVTTATFTAQLAGLKSDENSRDGRVRDALSTGQYPTTTFVLGSPIQLGSVPADGQEIKITASGKLTIRGVTRDVQFPMTARLSGGTLTVRGALEVKLADFGIPKPSSFLVLSIADTGTIEVQLLLVRS